PVTSPPGGRGWCSAGCIAFRWRSVELTRGSTFGNRDKRTPRRGYTGRRGTRERGAAGDRDPRLASDERDVCAPPVGAYGRGCRGVEAADRKGAHRRRGR